MKKQFLNLFNFIFKRFKKEDSNPFTKSNVINYNYSDYSDFSTPTLCSEKRKSNVYNSERKYIVSKGQEKWYLTEKQYNFWFAINCLNKDNDSEQKIKGATAKEVMDFYFDLLKIKIHNPIIEEWMLKISSHNNTIKSLLNYGLLKIEKHHKTNGKEINLYFATDATTEYN
jgi:hypothetical protein